MVLIKRYPNRKLYNTESKQYITLEGIADLIRQGQEVQVTDHASGEDLTALTLTQIILEQEKNKSGLLSNSFLTHLIRTSEDRLTALQRSLFSPGTWWKQMDEEIQKRIQDLVRQGEMTEREAQSLVEKFIQQGRRRLSELERDPESEAVEAALQRRQVPTQADLQKLFDQIDALTSLVEDLSAQPPTQENPPAE
jgi:polyhydroxyalkanoate synthesis repressor PhaR